MRAELVTRLEKAFPDPAARPVDGGVKRDAANNVVAILCLCQTQIAGPMPVVGREEMDKWSVRVPGEVPGQHIFGYYHTFQQVELEFDDMSKHMSHGCRNCWQSLNESTMERFYVRDLVGFEVLEAIEHEGMDPLMWAMLLKRRPRALRLVGA